MDAESLGGAHAAVLFTFEDACDVASFAFFEIVDIAVITRGERTAAEQL